ncbi:hypothetical protein pb186bvf_004252 [Paramecium bursaria]
MITMNYDELIKQKAQCIQTNQSDSKEYSTNISRQNEYFEGLYQKAQEKQQRLQLMSQQRESEIKNQANKIKIDQNSQKIVLKKLEQSIKQAIDKYSQNDCIDKEGLQDILRELGITSIKDSSVILNQLWDLGTFNQLLQNIYSNFAFSILVVLMENQLTVQQAQKLLEEIINVEVEDQGILEEELNQEFMDQIILELILKFKEISFRSFSSRNQSSQKKEVPQPAKNTIKYKQKSEENNENNRFEQLYEHSKQLQEKKRTLESMIQDDPECSFKPQLNQQPKRIENTFNRLYNQAQQIQYNREKLKESINRMREEQELSQCTFQPKLASKLNVPIIPVRGDSQVIERMKKAREMKSEKENYFLEQNNSYNKARPNRITKQEPFEFKEQASISKVKLYVDVKISKTKKARIAIREDDTAEQLAKNFSKIHSLNQDQFEVLKNTLQQYI